jgi:hypothetical protein
MMIKGKGRLSDSIRSARSRAFALARLESCCGTFLGCLRLLSLRHARLDFFRLSCQVLCLSRRVFMGCDEVAMHAAA